MTKYRVLTILLINILAILLVVKALFFDSKSGTNALFALIVIIFIFVFDFYAVIINYMFDNAEKKKTYQEVLFYTSLLLPILGVVYFIYL